MVDFSIVGFEVSVKNVSCLILSDNIQLIVRQNIIPVSYTHLRIKSLCREEWDTEQMYNQYANHPADEDFANQYKACLLYTSRCV